ncbi:hypothetical protein QBC45DRAFT_407827 [Copromyces sp. CBS 386.78]|nr:hypothetical protein QBC45DRAFT_407827 [Copromyces sp. CBS 386.78]
MVKRGHGTRRILFNLVAVLMPSPAHASCLSLDKVPSQTGLFNYVYDDTCVEGRVSSSQLGRRSRTMGFAHRRIRI